jgi:hypothetical protein
MKIQSHRSSLVGSSRLRLINVCTIEGGFVLLILQNRFEKSKLTSPCKIAHANFPTLPLQQNRGRRPCLRRIFFKEIR